MPDFRDYALAVPEPGQIRAMNTKPVGALLRDIMAKNMDNFRVFGPDENTSNKLDAIYEVSKKLWLATTSPRTPTAASCHRTDGCWRCCPSTPWKAGTRAMS
jgi:phosphoketolase